MRYPLRHMPVHQRIDPLLQKLYCLPSQKECARGMAGIFIGVAQDVILYRNGIGSMGSPAWRTSKWRWGPVESPVEPTAAMG